MLSARAYTQMYFHLVWGTKGRKPWLTTGECEKALYSYIGSIAVDKKWHLLAIGGALDHVHILLQKSPKYTISEVVRCIKSNSSRFMREHYLQDFAWQVGYGAFTIDKTSILRLKGYIANQKNHHDVFSYEKELELLERRYSYFDD